MIVYYSARDDGHRYRLELDATFTEGRYDLTDFDDQQVIVETCAEDWHVNHDGWEAHWPRKFTLYADKEGPALATFEVDREHVPSFSATWTA